MKIIAFDINLEGEPNKEFLDAYHEFYSGEEPGFLADFGYDSTRMEFAFPPWL